jgi:hypothetical protein
VVELLAVVALLVAELVVVVVVAVLLVVARLDEGMMQLGYLFTPFVILISSIHPWWAYPLIEVPEL